MLRGSDGCKEWRRRYWEGLVRRSMIQTRQTPSVFYCGIFLIQAIFECTCIRLNSVQIAVFFTPMFWVSHLINQHNATEFCMIRKYLLFCKTFKLVPAERAHWRTYQLMFQCYPVMPRYPPNWTCTDITFLCVYLYEWTWECNVLLVMKCGGSAHYWMQYSYIN